MDTLLGSVLVCEDEIYDLDEVVHLEFKKTVNVTMDAQTNEMLSEGNRRNGYREHTPLSRK